ncbi:hypothetical protein ROE7235_01205 [Roseibaca ekhonensis]|uniref:Bacterial OB-fold domain-containing protein n=1 Tax=Roseinatronobacter ekhonensis TaxID=254356 RepID=A0A3B0MPA8_9RHOB|nr:hypothetical protein [Roseibaca ekhonensis]SUZ31459.1 hypothetical protein ROE7235_01205 [Roseibaca ekhonensis]
MYRAAFLPALTTAALIALPFVGMAGSAMADTVIPISEAKRGMMVTVAGTVEQITDEDEFILSDPSDSIRVYVGPNWVPADVGEAVTVHGFIDNDLLRELYARTITVANGEIVTFERIYE